jgi:hypothetical protein
MSLTPQTNGLIIGTALIQLQQQHRQQLEVDDLSLHVDSMASPCRPE